MAPKNINQSKPDQFILANQDHYQKISAYGIKVYIGFSDNHMLVTHRVPCHSVLSWHNRRRFRNLMSIDSSGAKRIISTALGLFQTQLLYCLPLIAGFRNTDTALNLIQVVKRH